MDIIKAQETLNGWKKNEDITISRMAKDINNIIVNEYDSLLLFQIFVL